jgi:hypothetical protein
MFRVSLLCVLIVLDTMSCPWLCGCVQEELEAQLGGQTSVLKRVVEQCKQQEATIEHQRAVIEQQRGVMDQQRAALERSAAAQASGALASVDPGVLQVCDGCSVQRASCKSSPCTSSVPFHCAASVLCNKITVT